MVERQAGRCSRSSTTDGALQLGRAEPGFPAGAGGGAAAEPGDAGALLKQFHEKYQDEAKLEELVKKNKAKNWAALHTRMARQYRPENPDLPTLDPWRNTTKPPAEQFVFERNPFFHRVDENGRQLPYIDRFMLNVSSSSIIPAKTGAGETDLQVTGIDFDRLHLPQGCREALPDQGRSVEAHAGLARRAVAQPQLRRRRSGGRCCRTCACAARCRWPSTGARSTWRCSSGWRKESADTVLPESPLYQAGIRRGLDRA